MDHLDRMRLFARVVERRNFTAAAADLGLPRSTATEAIKQLEDHLCTRLLERTTRHVSPTLDGQAYYDRCLSILSELEDIEDGLRSCEPRGLLRIDAHPLLTQNFLLPKLPDFLATYPAINLHLGQGDRLVDLVREGIDCVIRSGEPRDSGMIMRRLATMREATCASPAYLEKFGVPHSPDELAHHQMIGFVSSASGKVLPLEFTVGNQVREVTLGGRVTVNNADSATDLARLGLGLYQAPRYRLEKDFAEGTLVEVLRDYPPTPTPLFALYPQNRQTTPRLRVFLDWAAGIFSDELR